MQQFKDKEGRNWTLELNLGTGFKVEAFDFAEALGEEEKTTISFLDAENEKLESYMTNTRVCFTMIWLCCQEQAEQRGIDNMLKFAECFDGPTLDAAKIAFWEELANFFPKKATTLRTLTRKFSEVMIAQDKTMAKAIEENISVENLDKMTRKILEDAKNAANDIFENDGT